MTKAEEFAASDKLWPDGPWFEYGIGDPQTYQGEIVGRVRVLCLSDLDTSPAIDEMCAELARMAKDSFDKAFELHNAEKNLKCS